MQLYEVQLTFNSIKWSVDKRYNQFHALQAAVRRRPSLRMSHCPCCGRDLVHDDTNLINAYAQIGELDLPAVTASFPAKRPLSTKVCRTILASMGFLLQCFTSVGWRAEGRRGTTAPLRSMAGGSCDAIICFCPSPPLAYSPVLRQWWSCGFSHSPAALCSVCP